MTSIASREKILLRTFLDVKSSKTVLKSIVFKISFNFVDINIS